MRISVAGVAKQGNRYFVALRKPGTSIGESWEFPGGKVEKGETPQEAITREFLEEFGTAAAAGPLLCRGNFTNGAEEYELLAFSVTLQGEPEAREHQYTAWKTLPELKLLHFAPSDGIILKALSEH